MLLSPSTKTALVRIPVALFCLWHVFAITVYATPEPAKDPVSEAVRTYLLPVVRPYVLSLSVWQQWNLFSPLPIYSATNYEIQVKPSGRHPWSGRFMIDSKTLGWWRSADEMSGLRQLQDDPEGYRPIWERYIQTYCAPLGLAPGSRIRVVFHTYEMPIRTPGQPLDWWRGWVPEWNPEPGPETTCPDPANGVSSILFLRQP